MTKDKIQEVVDFDDIALELNRVIQIEGREIITKGFMQSDIRKSLRIYVKSGDHNPTHFHVESKQRKYDQKFTTDSIINISKYQDNRFDAYIKKFFRDRLDFLKKIEKEFYKLNPELSL